MASPFSLVSTLRLAPVAAFLLSAAGCGDASSSSSSVMDTPNGDAATDATTPDGSGDDTSTIPTDMLLNDTADVGTDTASCLAQGAPCADGARCCSSSCIQGACAATPQLGRVSPDGS